MRHSPRCRQRSRSPRVLSLREVKTIRHFVLVLLVWSTLGSVASAGFNQVTCATSGWDTAVPVNLGAAEFIRQTTSPPGVAPDMTRYNHNVRSSWAIVSNANLSMVQPDFGYFVTETNYDYLSILDGAFTRTYTGAVNSSGSLVAGPHTWSFAGRAIAATWFADGSIANEVPPRVAQVRPRCKSSQSASVPAPLAISANTRLDGLLLKATDVIYFSVAQQARPMVITLDALAATAGADFDLYVSTTNSAPDDASHTWRSYTSGTSEALLIPAASPRTLYIGVRAYAGAGHFSLGASTTLTLLDTVCVTDNTLTAKNTLTAAERATAQEFLRAGAAHLYTNTNGNLFRAVYQMNTSWTGACNPDNGCSICLITNNTTQVFGEGWGSTTCGRVQAYRGIWQQGGGDGVATAFAHESGHSCFNISDKYTGVPNGQQTQRYCGHSNMANNMLAWGFSARGHCQDGNLSSNAVCDPASASDFALIKAKLGAVFVGQDYAAAQNTPNPAPSWGNARLRSLVTFIGF